MGKSTISMAIFNCYVSSPEGIYFFGWIEIIEMVMFHIYLSLPQAMSWLYHVSLPAGLPDFSRISNTPRAYRETELLMFFHMDQQWINSDLNMAFQDPFWIQLFKYE